MLALGNAATQLSEDEKRQKALENNVTGVYDRICKIWPTSDDKKPESVPPKPLLKVAQIIQKEEHAVNSICGN
jgi:hypothetical protein